MPAQDFFTTKPVKLGSFRINSGKAAPAAEEEKGFIEKGIAGVKEGFTTGGGKAFIDPFIGVGKTALEQARGVTSLLERGGRRLANVPLPEEKEVDVDSPTTFEKLIPPELTEREGGFQKAGEFALKTGELVAPLSKIPKGLSLLSAAGREALISAGIIGAQEAAESGDVTTETAKQAAIGGITGGTLPLLGGAAKAFLKPERLVRKALGITGNQAKELNKISRTKNIKGEIAHEGFEDFILKNKLLGEGGEVLSRTDLKKRAEDFFTLSRGSKKELLIGATEKTPNKFQQLLKIVRDKNNVDGLEDIVKEIDELAKVKDLSAVQLDRIRFLADDILPRSSFQDTTPKVTEGIQKLIDPIRKRLEIVDTTGTIKQTNTDIRLLKKLIDPDRGFLTKAAERGFSGVTTLKGATAGATALIPGVGPALSLLGLAEAALTVPQVSSTLARAVKALPEGDAVKLIQALIKSATTEGVTEGLSE